MDVPLELTDDSIPHEASFWSQMNDKHDYPRDAALQIQHRRSRSLDQAPVAGSLFPLPPLEVIRRGMDNVPSMKALDEYVDSSFLDDHIYPSEASSESSVEFDAGGPRDCEISLSSPHLRWKRLNVLAAGHV